VTTDSRRHKRAQGLLDAGEAVVAVPLTAAWASARTARNLKRSQGYRTRSRGNGVAGQLAGALGLERGVNERVETGEVVVLTDHRVLFCEPAGLFGQGFGSVTDAEPLEQVSLAWSEGMVSGLRWTAFCFRFADGSWRILEAGRGSALRRDPNREVESLVAGFGERGAEVALPT